MAVAATERAVDMSIFGVRLPFSSGADCLGMGRGAFLPMGGGGTRLGCFLVGGGDGNAGFATILELLTTVTLDLGEDFLAVGFEEPEVFLLVVFFSGFFLDTNEILLCKFTMTAPACTSGRNPLQIEGCAIVLATTTLVNPIMRAERSYPSQYCVFFQIAGAQVCPAQGAATHEWNPQSILAIVQRWIEDRDVRRHLVLE